MTKPASGTPKQAKVTQILAPSDMEVEAKFKSREDKVERAHRLRKDIWSFWIKEALTYVVALVVLLTAAVYCFRVSWHPGSGFEEKKWAMSIVTSLLVGIVGFVFGKVAK